MIIISLDDFKRYARLSQQRGRWETWCEYYFAKYEEVFSSMLKYLYRSTINSLKEAVETLDVDWAIESAQSFFRDNGLLRVGELLELSEAVYPFEQEYDLYFLIGLGHVDGTALPAQKPFLYFGLERYESLDVLKYLVSHEYGHMVRLWDVTGGELREDVTLGEIVVEEGLATVFSSVVLQGDLKEALLMSEADFEFCVSHADELVREVVECWEQPLNDELLEAYLKGSYEWRNGRPPRIGYFVGVRVVEQLLAQGYTIDKLMRLPVEEMITRYSALSGIVA